MILARTSYLDRLRRFLTAPAIIAVVGLRRVGKSVLLRQFADTLRRDRHVVYVDKESLEFDDIRSARNLVDLVESRSRPAEPLAVVVDEVQQIDGWERAAAALNGRERTKVIISGSNASMLAGELATHIAGRYVTLQVFPLTLRELGDLHRLRGDDLDTDALLRRYLRYGGLPGLMHTDLSDVVVTQMLQDIFSTIVVRDIIRRHRLRNVSLFEAVTRFAMDNVGNLISAKRIADFLKSQRRSTSVDTVLSYLAHLEEAFLLSTAHRYDVKGKRRLEVNHKHYLGDVGLRNGVIGYRDSDIGGVLENLVYLELRRRGYAVTVGSAGGREIDFVARDRRGIVYVQVAYLLESRATVERELAAFSAVDDAYPRVLLSLDPHQPPDFAGVRHRSLAQFLLGADLLIE